MASEENKLSEKLRSKFKYFTSPLHLDLKAKRNKYSNGARLDEIRGPFRAGSSVMILNLCRMMMSL